MQICKCADFDLKFVYKVDRIDGVIGGPMNFNKLRIFT